MGYEYDEKKSEAILQDRGIDFEFAARVFARDFIEYEDKRHDYGERRYVAIGRSRVPCSPWFTLGGTADGGLSQPGGPAGGNEMPTAERPRKRLARTGRVDWDRVDTTTEEEIARQIAEDPETAPEVTDKALTRAVVVSPDGTRVPYRERAGGPRSRECLRPVAKAPKSGRYEVISAAGEGTGVERTVARGETLPPTPASGQRYRASSSSKRRRGV